MGRGKVEGPARIVQILMFVANLIIWIGSIIILIFGIMAVANKPYLESMLGGSVYKSGAGLLIFVGIFAFIVAFLGCFGALKENKTMLLIYFVIVLILFILLLSGAIVGLVYKDTAEEHIMKGMEDSIRKYKISDTEPNPDAFSKAWDDGQMAMECCGIKTLQDWQNLNENFSYQGTRLPKSCCAKDPQTNARYNCGRSESSAFQISCYTKARDFGRMHGRWIGGAGISVAMFMLFGLVCSMLLYCMIKNDGK